MRIKLDSCLFLLSFLATCVISSKNDVNGTIQTPEPGCMCSWSPWMNSGEPNDLSEEDETFAHLRSMGYKFCKSPVDIQCYNEESKNTHLGFGAVCDVNLGLRCTLWCDDYSIRVACCYCPPENIGPEFQINSQSSTGGCLQALSPISESSQPRVVVAKTCDASDSSMSWAWVSNYALKNIQTKQCLAVTDNAITMEDCELNENKQKWRHMERASVLQLYGTSTYLYKSADNSVLLKSSRGSDSKWLAKVEKGTTSMKNMKSPECLPVEAPGNGSISCTLDQYVSSICTFSCKYGFRLSEDAENPSQCTDDGEFTAGTPVCEKILCSPAIASPKHGSVMCSNGNNLDSSCVHECDSGYALVGSNQLLCMDDGSWTHEQPSCQRVICEPELVKDGLKDGMVNCTDGKFYSSECTYTCHVGFELIGPDIRTCQLNEEWDESRPICQKIECPAIVASEHSSMSCTDSTAYLSTCRFTCDTGYRMVGSASATCNDDKTWGSEAPTCERKTCNVLSDPMKGEISCDDGNFYGSSCTFTCDRGYKIDGEDTLMCTGEGWDFGAPKCSQITCSRQVNPTNGVVSCTKNELFGSTCTFTCDRGYKPATGSATKLRCTEDGWDGTAPVCEQITCPEVLTVRNGRQYCSNKNIFQSSCFIICNEGYDLPSGAQTGPIMCEIDGTWSTPPPTCKRIQCRDINTLHKGIMTCSDMNNFNSTCTFQCKEGYNLLGAKQATCTKSGWDAQTPNCGRLTCSPPLARPSNGQITCRTSGLPVCNFSCNPGYRLIGPTSSKCQRDETWSVTEIPICEIIQCPTHPKSPPHGNVTCNKGRTFDSVCEFDCDVGYKLLGERSTRCTEDRTWDQALPSCERISCPAIDTPAKGQVQCRNGRYYKSKCNFECNNGYKLVGSSDTECLLDSTWNNPVPYCERITCSPSYTNPSNGRVECSDENNYDSNCEFACEDGFSLEGKAVSVCGESGWSLKQLPMCKKITCPLDEAEIPFGSVNCDRANEYKSVCTFVCNHGYEVVGAKTVKCTKQGTWNGKKPSCKEIVCPPIPPLKNGEVVCRKQYLYDSECYFLCDQDYDRKPDISTVKCMANKRWNPAGFPLCALANKTEKLTIPAVQTTPKPTTVPTTATTASTTVSTTTTRPPRIVTTAVASDVVESTGRGLWATKKLINHLEPTEETTMAARGDTTTRFESLSAHGVAIISPSPDVTVSEKAPEEQNGSMTVIIIAVVGSVAALVVVSLLVFFLVCKKRSKKSAKYNNGPVLIKDNNRYDHELGPLLPNGDSGVKRFGSISMDRLEMEYNRRHADDDKLFREEYHALTDGKGTKEAGGRAQNKDKNRYTNILPYDHSRVILPKIGIEADSDYINASFVDGYKHKGKFIAAQGPKENTIVDFWRMVWEQNVSNIIMATNLEERKEPKCARYWPTNGQEQYGDLMVTYMGENHLVDYTIRLFTVLRASGDSTLSTKRNITQYHFTSWPDFGVPKSPSGILKFLRKIKHSSPTGYGPIVVHCSAGVGRTGTFICIDGMMDMISRENKIDVYTFSAQMRQQRPEMVQTEQQYIFIYQAILEHHLYGDTEVEASEVSGHIDELMERLPGNVTGMEHEFKKLTSIRIQKEHMRAGNHPANMRKNRVLLILPYDWNRVMLPIKRGQENTDYINASYIDGYRSKDVYIATQGPLPHTVEDFWRMIWDSQSASIVMLTELAERGQGKCAQYWPNEGMVSYGEIRIELLSTKETEDYTERDFRISNDTPNVTRQQIVKQFHYHGWPEVGAPVSGYSMIELVEAVQRQQQSSGNHPIVIHCSAGAGRTGAFCALSTALEQVKAEGVLDMFQIVKCLRMQRPHMVQNLEQYEFCYRAVQEYIDSMSEYYNFK